MGELVNDYINATKTITGKVIHEKPSVMATVLKEVVMAEGAQVYRDVAKLSGLLQKKGLKNSYIKQVELAVCGSSLERYLDQLSNGLTAIDINNIILTAEGAGLSSGTARKIVADILFSLNVPQLAQDVPVTAEKEAIHFNKIYIPPRAYSFRLHNLVDEVERGKVLDEEQFSELNSFADAGIPGAHTLIGRLYLKGLGVPQDNAKALEYLKYAASYGDAAAFGLLGDYYYGKDNKMAYRLYSRPGAMALNEERWGNFRNLEKCKRFHRTQAILFLILCLLIEIFMFSFCSSVVTGEHFAAAIVCSVINVLVVAGMAVIHIKNPYQDLRRYSLPMLLIFFVFGLILI